MQRLPRAPLRPFVEQLWLADQPAGAARERVLPTGAMHLVLRLSDVPLRVFDGVDEADAGREVGCAIVGGARSTYYVRDTSRPVRSVGVMLRPGASLPLLGVPAEALAGRHTRLEELWGREAGELRERLLEAADPLAVLEASLVSRLPRVRGVHPAVAHALARFDATWDVGAVVAETGYSHRRFLTLFREAVGLAPKAYCRVRRFQRVLEGAGAWSELAQEAGYSDQAHLTREFTELAGVSPGQFRRLAPAQPRHVPVVQLRSRRQGQA